MSRPSALLFYRIAATPNVNLGRIRSIVTQAMGQERGKIKSFALLSPSRESWEQTLGVPQEPSPSRDTPEFEARTQKLMRQQLKQDLAGMTCGWGPDRHPCGYREGLGIGQEGPKNVEETSFFVPNISLKDAHALWKKYYQWGIIYTGPETKGRIILMGHGDNGSFVIEDIGAMWTFTHPDNQKMMEDNREDFPNKSQFSGKDLVFASLPSLLRPRGR